MEIKKLSLLFDTSALIEIEKQPKKYNKFLKEVSSCVEKLKLLIPHEVKGEYKKDPIELFQEDLKNYVYILPKKDGKKDTDDILIEYLKEYRDIFLITQDERLRRRCLKEDGIFERIFLWEEFIPWVNEFVFRKEVKIEKIVIPKFSLEELGKYPHLKTHRIFDSVKEDYPTFEEWWDEKVVKENRKAWIVFSGDEVVGISILKENCDNQEYDGNVLKNHLKICTFIIDERMRRQRLGERLLYFSLKYALSIGAPSVVVEIKERRKDAIGFFRAFGFEEKMKKKNTRDELVFEKRFRSMHSEPIRETIYRCWPSLTHYIEKRGEKAVRIFVAPIKEKWAKRLFFYPMRTYLLDDFLDFNPNTYGIKKVYFTCSNIRKIYPGDIVFFCLTPQRKIIAAGVVLEKKVCKNYTDAIHFGANIMAYTSEELEKYIKSCKAKDVLGIKFLLFEEKCKINSSKILRKTPQALTEITDENKKRRLIECAKHEEKSLSYFSQ